MMSIRIKDLKMYFKNPMQDSPQKKLFAKKVFKLPYKCKMIIIIIDIIPGPFIFKGIYHEKLTLSVLVHINMSIWSSTLAAE